MTLVRLVEILEVLGFLHFKTDFHTLCRLVDNNIIQSILFSKTENCSNMNLLDKLEVDEV